MAMIFLHGCSQEVNERGCAGAKLISGWHAGEGDFFFNSC
jgi:hypothetical protein